MSRKTGYSRTLVFSLALAAILVGLGVLPKLLLRTKFIYTASGEIPPGAVSFPVAELLPLLEPGGKLSPRSFESLLPAESTGMVVNFWATWCPPCVEELPSLELLHRQLKSQKGSKVPTLITVSVDEAIADVTKFFKTLDFTPSFSVLHDPQGPFSKKVGSIRFPETYLVGRDGKVVFKWLGPQDWLSEEVIQKFKQLAAH